MESIPITQNLMSHLQIKSEYNESRRKLIGGPTIVSYSAIERDGSSAETKETCHLPRVRSGLDNSTTVAAHTAPNDADTWKGIGLILTLLASFSIAAHGICVYAMSHTMDPFQISAMVGPYQLIWSTLAMALKGVALPTSTDHLRWIVPSGFLVVASSYLFANSCRCLLLSDASAAVHVSLLIAGIMSYFILRESFSLYDFCFAILAFTGVVCMARPASIFGLNDDANPLAVDRNVVLGMTLALVCAFCKTISYILIRKQGLIGVHLLQSNVVAAIIKVALSALLCTFVGDWHVPTSVEWLYSTGAGISYVISQITLFLALGRETVPFVIIVLSSEMIASFILQVILFTVTPMLSSWAGTLLVILACTGTTAMRHGDIRSQISPSLFELV